MTAAISWGNQVPNDSDGAVAVSTVSGSFTSLAINSGYPGENAIDTDPSSVTRVNYTNGGGGDSTLGIAADWGSDETVRVVAALNVRLPASGFDSVRFVVINAASSTQETTTAVALADLVPIPGTDDRFDLFAILTADRSVASVRLEVVNVDASASDYVEVGHLWAGKALVLSGASAGFDRDWAWQPIDDSIVARGYGGAVAVYRFQRRQRLTVSKRLLTYAQAIGTSGSPSTPNLRALAHEVGVSAPVCIVTRDTNAHTLQALSVYGLVTEPTEIGHLGADYFGAGMVVEQIR